MLFARACAFHNPAGIHIRNFREAIGGSEPRFTKEQKEEIIFKYISNNLSVAFYEIIQYLGSNLEEEVVEKCYKKLSAALYEQIEKKGSDDIAITINRIYHIYKNTGIQAKLNNEKIKKLYQSLYENPIKEDSDPTENMWIIYHIHKATGINYPMWDKKETKKMYDSLIKFNGYDERMI